MPALHAFLTTIARNSSGTENAAHKPDIPKRSVDMSRTVKRAIYPTVVEAKGALRALPTRPWPSRLPIRGICASAGTQLGVVPGTNAVMGKRLNPLDPCRSRSVSSNRRILPRRCTSEGRAPLRRRRRPAWPGHAWELAPGADGLPGWADLDYLQSALTQLTS
ncbi:hypothetical protein GY45DRAFT_30129 [Cubamyces sp. BRFM 1775]|nr:hypothetical protein GY45DRAFT_30129 [Cubamyces sp. BRFM 1775]